MVFYHCRSGPRISDQVNNPVFLRIIYGVPILMFRYRTPPCEIQSDNTLARHFVVLSSRRPVSSLNSYDGLPTAAVTTRCGNEHNAGDDKQNADQSIDR